MMWTMRPGAKHAVGIVIVVAGAIVLGLAVASSQPTALSNSALAAALGDEPDMQFGGTHVRCVATRGRTAAGDLFNRVCHKVTYEGLCSPGTGELRSTLLIRVVRRRFNVVDNRPVGVYEPCASVA